MSVDPIRRRTETSTAREEIVAAIEAYMRRSGRVIPTWSEVLEVIRGLGYAKSAPREGLR